MIFVATSDPYFEPGILKSYKVVANGRYKLNYSLGQQQNGVTYTFSYAVFNGALS